MSNFCPILSSLSSLVRRSGRRICFFLSLCPLLTITTSAQAQHPKITGISHVRIHVHAFCKAHDFYSKVLGNRLICPAFDAKAEPVAGTMALWTGQFITINTSGSSETDLLEHVGFATDDAALMRNYLKSSGVEVGDLISPPGALSFTIKDPENHRIEFVQRRTSAGIERARVPPPQQRQIIHAGFIVRDRAAMEHFYKDILGFRPYWHGGMKDDETNWVSLQVPDGSDWIEFMLNVPDNADQRLRGIMNHIALGVKDIHATQEQLHKNGAPLTEEPKIGRDGKWQLNLYDPDGTRVEFMEFTPVQKPCCSEFTAPHPKP